MINKKLLKRASALTAMVMALSVLVACSSGEKSDANKSETTTAATEVVAGTSTETATNLEPETEAATEVSADDSKDYFEWFGINMYRPAEYNVDTSSGHPECWLDDHSGSLTYYTYHDSEIDSVTPESFMEQVYNGVEITYLTKPEMKYGHIHDNQIESEEKVQVNGNDFIRQQGVYTLSDSSEDRKVAYVAYFGTLEFENFGKQPAAWIAMSHSEDEAVKTKVLEVADKAAENCKPIS